MTVVLLVVAGGLGAVLRDEVLGLIHRRSRRTTLVAVGLVNVSGALALGGLLGSGAGAPLLLVFGAGLLGGYTTFSTWAVAAALSPARRAWQAMVLQTGCGLAAVLGGRGLASLL